MLKKIFESTLTMGASSGAVILIDLVRVKFLAVFLGPEGVGVLSVLNHFLSVVVTLAALGLGTGIVRYVARHNSRGEHEKIQKVLASAFSLVLPVSLAVFILCAFFRTDLSVWLLKDASYSWFFIVYAATLPLAVYSQTSASLLQGIKQVPALAKINIIRALATLCVVIPLIWLYGLPGAVVSVLGAAAIHVSLSAWYVRKRGQGFRVAVISRPDSEITGKLFHYGGTSLVVGGAMVLSHLLMKMIIVRHLGQAANGIYQPVWALTMAYPTIVLSSMSTYSYPRMCELSDNKALVEELNGILRVSLLFITPIMLFLLTARKPVIWMLYSSQFLEAAQFMHIQIFGDFLRVLFWALGMYLLPGKRLFAFILVNLLQNAMLVGGSLLLVGPLGLTGMAVAFAVSWVPSLVFLWFHARIRLGFVAWGKNRLLAASTCLAILGASAAYEWLDKIPYAAVCVLIAVLWALVNLNKEETAKLKVYLSEKWGAFRRA